MYNRIYGIYHHDVQYKSDDSQIIFLVYPETGLIAMGNKLSKRFGTVGTIYNNVNLKVVDCESQNTMGPNFYGEICCKSPCMMNGYYQRSAATRFAINDDGSLQSVLTSVQWTPIKNFSRARYGLPNRKINLQLKYCKLQCHDASFRMGMH